MLPPFPNRPRLVRGAGYPGHDAGWQLPAFRDLVICQLHICMFWGGDRFFDVVEKVPNLRDLGINAIQLLPIQEYDGDIGLGHSGLNYFSPEMACVVEDPAKLGRPPATMNQMPPTGRRRCDSS